MSLDWNEANYHTLFLHFTQLTSQNSSLSTVNANFKRMEITKSINKLTTDLYIYRNVILYIISLGQLNNLLRLLNIIHLLYTKYIGISHYDNV